VVIIGMKRTKYLTVKQYNQVKKTKRGVSGLIKLVITYY